MKVDAVRYILERTFQMPVAESEAQIVLDRLNEIPSEDKMFGYTAGEWMFALLELLDGSAYPTDIQYSTGLPLERCQEISKMFYAATASGWPERNKESK